MAFRNKHTLDEWLDEFRAFGYPISGSLRVIEQDGADGADTGLIGVAMTNASTSTYIQPDPVDPSRWVVTFDSRETPVQASPTDVLALANELVIVATLCGFLQVKSDATAADQQA
ncbi:hypothetical protein AB0N73_04730 [Microbacterium sp. NPDC089189]|uniref:hypothetical protein n=1 Tax=Microbacterium sp. NPDC089189 TaxID=3154972 RepID=UPI003437B227